MDEQRWAEKIAIFLKKSRPNWYTFQPVATEAEVLDFEDKFKIKIPPDLRWFVLNIANGITSPDPIDHLTMPIDFLNYRYLEEETNPGLPFKLTERTYWGLEDWDHYSDYPYVSNYIEHIANDYLNGGIDMAAFGCGTVSFIVVNGEEYGNIWTDDVASNNVTYPEYDDETDKQRLTFEEWIHSRMDLTISRYDHDQQMRRKYPQPRPEIIFKTPPEYLNQKPVRPSFLRYLWQFFRG